MRSRRAFSVVCIVLLGIGATAAWFFGDLPEVSKTLRTRQLIVAAVAIAVACLPPLRSKVQAVADALNRALASRRLLGAAGAMLLVAIPLGLDCYLTAHRRLELQDEHSYMIQTQMLAHGRLWMHSFPPDIQPFFDTYYVLMHPVYASIYFPGTALMMLPIVWLGIPFWIMTLLVILIAAALLYAVIDHLFDSAKAILAVVMLIALRICMDASHSLLSQAPSLMLDLLMVLALLRWRQSKTVGWAVAMGVAAGWAAITRPVEALCYAIPIGVAMLLDLRGHRPAVWARSLASVLLAAAPFLVLQAIQNLGITGKLTQFPADLYVAQNYPAPMAGFHHIDWNNVPKPSCREKQFMNEIWIWPRYREHTVANIPEEWMRARLRMTVGGLLLNPWLLVLVPVAAIGRWNRGRAVLAIPLLLFLCFYVFFVFYFVHYLLPVVPCAIVLVLVSLEAAEKAAGRYRSAVWTAFTFVTIALAGYSIWAIDTYVLTVNPRSRTFWQGTEGPIASNTLERLPRQPAVVMFRFDFENSTPHAEMVYND